MDKFEPTHTFKGTPVVLVEEGWAGQEVPAFDGVELPIGVYDAETWTAERWPRIRATRDGQVAEWEGTAWTWIQQELVPLNG